MFTTIENNICPPYLYPGNGIDELFENPLIIKSLLFLLLDGVIYTILGLYLDVFFYGQEQYKYNPFYPFIFLFKFFRRYFKKDSGNLVISNIEDSKILLEEQLIYPTNVLELTDPNVGAEKINAESNNPNYVLKVRNLVHKYTSDKKAIDNLCLALPKNEVLGILGPNGSGKSTFLNILTGILKPTSGSISIDGSDLKYFSENIADKVSYCPQENYMFDLLSMEEHFLFAARLEGHSISEEKRIVQNVLSKMKIDRNTQRRVASKLSGGLKRRLCIGLTLIFDPPIIFLDEPTEGLDIESKREIWDIISKEREKTIIIATHSLQEADLLCQRISILSKGKMMCIGTPIYLKEKYGKGFRISISFNKEDRGKVNNHFKSLYPNAILNQQFYNYSVFTISKKTCQNFTTS
jgi:ABC-type multidrug transport system ATPase subunit